MTRVPRLVSLAALLLAPTFASAQVHPSRSSGELAGGDRYQTTTRHAFDDEEVEGERAEPSTTLIGVRVRAAAPSLVPVRKNFMSEMMKSAEDL